MIEARFARLATEGREYITPEIERRRYRRAKLVTQLKCVPMQREEILLSRDISVGGMFLKTPRPLPKDSEVQVTFRLNADLPAIECAGKVIYSGPGMGMGIEFQQLSEEARKAIQAFVDESL